MECEGRRDGRGKGRRRESWVDGGRAVCACFKFLRCYQHCLLHNCSFWGGTKKKKKYCITSKTSSQSHGPVGSNGAICDLQTTFAVVDCNESTSPTPPTHHASFWKIATFTCNNHFVQQSEFQPCWDLLNAPSSTCHCFTWACRDLFVFLWAFSSRPFVWCDLRFVVALLVRRLTSSNHPWPAFERLFDGMKTLSCVDKISSFLCGSSRLSRQTERNDNDDIHCRL